jgi:hypothetical protein
MEEVSKAVASSERSANDSGLPGIPEGWVWRSYQLPAPNGDGVILIDGWGPPEEPPEGSTE